MSTTVKQIVTDVRRIARDKSSRVLLDDDAPDLVTEAQRAVAVVRPDAKSESANIPLVAGAKQTLGTGQRRLMDVVRNMGTDGISPGKAVRGPIDREVLDSYNPDWITATGSAVEGYLYDKEVPTVFYVTPNVTPPWEIEVLVAVEPAAVTDITDNIDLPDIYVPAIREFVTYLHFARDDETSPSWARGGRHLQNFYELLGIKTRADLAIAPEKVAGE